MEFTNLTGFPARYQAGASTDTEMLGIIASKVTFVLEDGGLVPVTDEEEAWPVFEKPFLFRGVSLAQELEFRKRGVDVLVFGNAVAPGGRPVREMDVAVRSGQLHYSLRVFGDRYWQKSWGRLKPTEPEPFTEMPLTNDRAYGGAASFQGNELQHAVNPDGRGFYMEKAGAEGGPLPNLERPGQLIEAWTDSPQPACLYKPSGRNMDPEAAARDPYELVPEILRDTFNQTVRELVVEPEGLGDRLHLQGFDPQGAVEFPLPALRGPLAHVSVGELRSRFPSTLSTLVALVPERVLIATYVCLFRYVFRPEEKRAVVLRWPEQASQTPAVTERKGGQDG